MQTALQKLFAGARDGIVDTQVEFGKLESISPLKVKLDEDPAPLEEDELVYEKEKVFVPQDVGTRLALLRCSNGQYLILMGVNG